jgi:flagellar M-ring protein FliF
MERGMPIPNLLLNLKSLLKGLPPAKMITLLMLISGTVAGFVILLLWTGKADYQILYANLTQEDAGAIITKLKERRIPYQISSNGGSILIPAGQIYETRMEMASEGLPQGGGIGFEIFDNTKLGMTEFLQNVNFQRALQGELSRTINGFSEVEHSRVHIVLASESLFLENEKPATASVVVKLRPGKWLSRDQVQGIAHLVSSSVSGLKPENVTVVDNFGEVLSGLKDKSTMGQIRSEQLEFKEQMERRLEESVRTMLEKALGPSRAIVRLSCSVDFKRSEKTEEKYLSDNKVVRSEQLLDESSVRPEKKAESARAKPDTPGTGDKKIDATAGTPSYRKQDRTVNYEIGKVTSHVVEPVGKINRISVAVLVDGTYKVVEVKEGAGKDGKTEVQYSPRTREEMEKLENIVKRAVNFDAERGDKVEVANIPFHTSETVRNEGSSGSESWWSKTKTGLPMILKYGISALIFMFAFLFILRPLIQWITSGPGSDMELLQQLPKTVGEIEQEYDVKGSRLPFMDQATQMIRQDQNSSMKLMNNWLKES